MLPVSVKALISGVNTRKEEKEVASVTRFVKSSTLWQNLDSLWQFLIVYIALGKRD